jgi:hypothetical protein
MKSLSPVIIALSFLCFQVGGALAGDASPPKTTATRPAEEHPNETSLPSNAPPATGTQTTGSTSQDPTTKQMNAEEKKKLETEGK